MRRILLSLALLSLIVSPLAAGGLSQSYRTSRDQSFQQSAASRNRLGPPLRVNSLCEQEERTIFNCVVKRSSKIISLCGSSDLDKEKGYIQYRFGRPEKIELEFPRERKGTQQRFRYAHYFRAQVDETEISFDNGNYVYRIFDYFQGDAKPTGRSQGLIVTPPGTKSASTEFQCASALETNYSDIGEILPCDPDSAINLDGCP